MEMGDQHDTTYIMYLDILPDELITMLIHELKTTFLNLSYTHERYHILYENFTDRIKNGKLSPTISFESSKLNKKYVKTLIDKLEFYMKITLMSPEIYTEGSTFTINNNKLNVNNINMFKEIIRSKLSGNIIYYFRVFAYSPDNNKFSTIILNNGNEYVLYDSYESMTKSEDTFVYSDNFDHFYIWFAPQTRIIIMIPFWNKVLTNDSRCLLLETNGYDFAQFKSESLRFKMLMKFHNINRKLDGLSE